MAQKPGVDLRQVIKQLYRWTDTDRRGFAALLMRQRREAYRRALEEEARRAGCEGAARRARPPSRGSLQELDRLSEEDAASVARTWNGDVERQVDRLYEENRRGNRYFYYSRMEKWAGERAKWKDAQIALFTESSARQLAKSDFARFNRLRGVRYRFVGPPPREPVCARLMGMGEVTQEVVDQNPCPIHINCPHEWELVRGSIMEQVDCRELWVG